MLGGRAFCGSGHLVPQQEGEGHGQDLLRFQVNCLIVLLAHNDPVSRLLGLECDVHIKHVAAVRFVCVSQPQLKLHAPLNAVISTAMTTTPPALSNKLSA